MSNVDRAVMNRGAAVDVIAVVLIILDDWLEASRTHLVAKPQHQHAIRDEYTMFAAPEIKAHHRP